MQFYDSSNNTGIVDDILFKTNTNTTEYPLKDITRHVNIGYSKVAAVIIKADGRMRWDDTNHTNFPISTFDLVSGQEDYAIFTTAPTALQDWLEVIRLDIKDSNGNWFQLRPFNEKDLNGIAFNDYESTDGQPHSFTMIGTSAFLKPAPNYNSDEGGQFMFNRAPSYFASTDTTKVPGFAVLFHPILSLWGQLGWYEKCKDWNTADRIKQSIQLMEKDIADFYMKRSKFEKPHLARLGHKYL